MYQMAAFSKEEHITDLDILERALECARGEEADFKNLFPEQQVREALERLKGRMYQYETSRKERLLSTSEYEALREMLLRGEDEFLKVMEGIFCRAEVNRTLNVYDIQQAFQKIYQNLYENVLEEYSYFDLYFDAEDISGLENRKIGSIESLYDAVMDIGRKMLELICLFRLDTKSELIQQVADYTWRNVEKNISLEKIAEALFINKTYLSHLFKQETGRTFVNFFTEIRMLRSRVLLRRHYRVYECALQLGYEDAEYFSKVFKNYYGCKPTEYMAQLDSQAFHHNSRAVCQQ